jgi:hypothetical protein
VSSGSEIGREYRILAAIVFTGFAARAACIWLARPEFVGWFNHSYYYWVQVKGLLQILGMAMGPAIVNTTRAVMSIVPALIAVTHIGTLAVTLLFFLAVTLAVLLDRANSRQIIGALILLLACSGVGLMAVSLLDAGAFQRVLLYARSSLPDSLLGNLFSSDPQVRKSMSLLGILIPLAAFIFLLRIYRLRRTTLQTPDRLFWLANTLFAYLLVLPLFDLDLVPRFILFLPIPAIVILSYYVGSLEKGPLVIVLIGLASAGVTAMLFGEVMNLIFQAPHKEAIHRELANLEEQYALNENDFILTRYGVNPICNWFLGTRSGLITSLHQDDFRAYDRVFVLNPSQGSMVPAQVRRGEAKDACRIMRSNVPLPADIRPLTETEHLSFYELPAVPGTWRFNDDGNWIGTEDDTATAP